MNPGRKQRLRWLKWIWAGLAILAVGTFLVRGWDRIQASLTQLDVVHLVLAIIATVAAKLLLGANASIAANRCGIAIGYVDATRLYNISQLGKYIPGSVWQFVGRAAAYRGLGASYGAIRDSLLVESFWVVAAAGLLGSALVGTYVPGWVQQGVSTRALAWLSGLAVLGLAATVCGLAWKRRELRRYVTLVWPSGRLLAVQAAVWCLLGLGFWVLALGVGLDLRPGYAIGLFALAFALGFLVPIAPAGLGIRDAILTLGLVRFGSLEQALAVTLVARLVYLFAEVGIVAIQEAFWSRLRA
jgi:uncharacterized membrane protein YbhN (UPF0104 family)